MFRCLIDPKNPGCFAVEHPWTEPESVCGRNDSASLCWNALALDAECFGWKKYSGFHAGDLSVCMCGVLRLEYSVQIFQAVASTDRRSSSFAFNVSNSLLEVGWIKLLEGCRESLISGGDVRTGEQATHWDCRPLICMLTEVFNWVCLLSPGSCNLC